MERVAENQENRTFLREDLKDWKEIIYTMYNGHGQEIADIHRKDLDCIQKTKLVVMVENQ